MPEITYRAWRYSTSLSQLSTIQRSWLLAGSPGCFTPGNKPPVLCEQGTWRTTEQVWIQWRNEKSPTNPAGILTTILWLSSQNSHWLNYDILIILVQWLCWSLHKLKMKMIHFLCRSRGSSVSRDAGWTAKVPFPSGSRYSSSSTPIE
jgi:hypothetical protein